MRRQARAAGQGAQLKRYNRRPAVLRLPAAVVFSCSFQQSRAESQAGGVQRLLALLKSRRNHPPHDAIKHLRVASSLLRVFSARFDGDWSQHVYAQASVLTVVFALKLDARPVLHLGNSDTICVYVWAKPLPRRLAGKSDLG